MLFSVSGLQAAFGKRPPGYAVASAHPLATRAGLAIMRKGGNAFDAAVAVSAVLAVVEPYSSGLGGGGFWLLYQQRLRRSVMIDGREKAPLGAHRNMYLDSRGRIRPGASIDGPLAAGIPGQPAALVHIAQRYGRLPLKVTLAPAIELAERGFRVDRIYRRMAGFRLKALRASKDAARIFLRHGQVPDEGTLIVQKDLAATLRAIAARGHKGFYRGVVARRLVSASRRHGGIWTLEDLAAYRVVERRPLQIRYKGLRITTVVPPSSGGIVLAQILNMLAVKTSAEKKFKTPAKVRWIHLVVEAMRRAYRDRARYLGDSDFVTVPVNRLVSRRYARRLARDIVPGRATPSSRLPMTGEAVDSHHHTTHFSIIDRDGNRVAATLSINYPFGSGFVAAGTGVLFNDEMDDFSSKPGSPNVYGLIGAQANAIAPGKRPLSSMSPSFVETDDRVAILGTPGGSRIITMVLLAILDFERGASAARMVGSRRYHHQYLPDVIQYEPGAFSPAVESGLLKNGHKLRKIDRGFGNMQVIVWDKKNNNLDVASDPRGIGKAEAVH